MGSSPTHALGWRGAGLQTVGEWGKVSWEEEFGGVLPFPPGSGLERQRSQSVTTTAQMPTPPSSGVALRYAERWCESLYTTFTSRREVPHLPSPFRVPIGPGWYELITYEGANCPSSLLPPDGTKPDRRGLTATADARGSAYPTAVSAHPPGS